MKSLVMLRGLPGSGKSSLAHLLSDGKWPVYSVDDYFTDAETGAYEFRFAENHRAYERCQQGVEEAMRNGTGRIFVDNTFTLEWEMEPYFRLAEKYGYRVHVATVERRHAGTNIHGISSEQLQKMAEKYRVVLF